MPPHLEQCLRIDNVSAHVPRLLGQIGLADEDRLFEIAYLAIFVGERGEIPTWILVEFLFEFVNSGRTGHEAPSIATRDRGPKPRTGRKRIIHSPDGTSQS